MHYCTCIIFNVTQSVQSGRLETGRRGRDWNEGGLHWHNIGSSSATVDWIDMLIFLCFKKKGTVIKLTGVSSCFRAESTLHCPSPSQDFNWSLSYFCVFLPSRYETEGTCTDSPFHPWSERAPLGVPMLYSWIKLRSWLDQTLEVEMSAGIDMLLDWRDNCIRKNLV